MRAVRRNRSLRWLVRGTTAGPVDVATWLVQRLVAVEAPGDASPDRPAVDDLPDLLAGTELAAARLVVAVLDPDTEPVATVGVRASESSPGEVHRG